MDAKDSKLKRGRQFECYAPVKITVRGKGKAGREEAQMFLKTLAQLRYCDGHKIEKNNGELTITLNASRTKRNGSPQIKRHAFENTDGTLLVLSSNENGAYDASLEENLGQAPSEKGLVFLIRKLQSIAGVDNFNAHYSRDPDGKEKLFANFSLCNIQEPIDLEDQMVKEIQLYRNLQAEFNQRLNNMRKPPSKDTLDYIYQWTNLTPRLRYKNKLSMSEKESDEVKKLVKVADFVREFYGIIEIRSGVNKRQIQSSTKKPKIARERHIAMYATSKKFPFLTLVEIGKIFGTFEKPKNHATVILTKKLFDESVGLKPKSYRYGTGTTTYSTQKLYADAEIKYESLIAKNKETNTDRWKYSKKMGPGRRRY